MSWDPFQREVLAELGHVVYRQASIAAASVPEAVTTEARHGDAAASDDPMLARVARAAGMSAEALQARLGDMQLVASLRGNSHAKRALWPRLRALRSRPRA